MLYETLQSLLAKREIEDEKKKEDRMRWIKVRKISRLWRKMKRHRKGVPRRDQGEN